MAKATFTINKKASPLLSQELALNKQSKLPTDYPESQAIRFLPLLQ